MFKRFCEGKLQALAIWTSSFYPVATPQTPGQTKGTSWPDHTLWLHSRTLPRDNNGDPNLEMHFYTTWFLLKFVSTLKAERRKADTFFRNVLMSGIQAVWEGKLVITVWMALCFGFASFP